MIARAPSEAFSERIDYYRERVNDRLEQAVDRDDGVPDRLRSAMVYSVLGAGKRIRPLLAYASAEFCGLDPASVDAVAAAVELIHAYSLVHDDLPAMDDDDLRRGRPTTHRAFDEATAILAGDALQALAFEVLATDRALVNRPQSQARMMALLARAAGPAGMVGGQVLDLEAEDRALDEAALETVHRHKTGRLIHAAIMMPTTLADFPESSTASLDRFARDIGLVFQIRDDLLEVEQDTATLGKNADSDSTNSKSTYPSVLGIEGARARADELYNAAMQSLSAAGGNGEGLRYIADFILKRSY